MFNVEYMVYMLISIYRYVIIAYVLMSWLPNLRDSYVGELIGKICEPYLGVFRRFIPPIGGMIDISPIVALIALQFVGMGIVAVLNFVF